MVKRIPEFLPTGHPSGVPTHAPGRAERPIQDVKTPEPASCQRAGLCLAALSLAVAIVLRPTAAAAATKPDFQSQYLAVSFSPTEPAFSGFTVDSLGQGRLGINPILADTNSVPELSLQGQFSYAIKGKPIWNVHCGEKTLTLRSDYAPGIEAPPFVLQFNQHENHATLLGLMKPGERRMALPCVLHLPDMGTLRITGNGWLAYDARRFVKTPFVRIAFPPATQRQRHVEYRFDVVSIYPKLPGIDKNPRYDGFRRDWLNIFQVNPRVQMLANNASSDPVAFTVFEYSDLAVLTPPLAPNLTCLDLIRMTVDRYLAGEKGYGQVGYACAATDADLIPWKTPWTSLDSLPSLLISACNYIKGAHDEKWARARYDQLMAWGRQMMAADHDGNGLIAYPGTGNFGDRPLTARRPSNWWDTINFGHEDAFANALAYRACGMMAELATQLKHPADAQFFADKAARLHAAYARTFLDPATGVLAGWRSADGHLHNYWFPFVQGIAVTYGLLDRATANSVMDKLLAKMQQVGYSRFELGLPGNLVPIKRGDYVLEHNAPERTGEPLLQDGSDGFQFYENGGATGCWAYYTVAALYKLGRVEDARRIFYPMLEGYARGEFQGFGANGMSRDWRDWQGGGHGYEGLLVDNYYALLAVCDDVRAAHAPVRGQ